MSDSPLSKLPLDLLTDNILPLLPASSLAQLSATSRVFREFVDGEEAEIVWKRKAIQDFNFPPHTGRRSGWKELYKRLSRRSTYVWGELRCLCTLEHQLTVSNRRPESEWTTWHPS